VRVHDLSVPGNLSRVSWKLSRTVLRGGTNSNVGPLLGLFEKWHRKWKGHAQPPTFYWGFRQLRSKTADTDLRLLAARAGKTTVFAVTGEETAGASKLLDNPQLASSLLSAACMRVFQGDKELRSTARGLDYFAYGPQLLESGRRIGAATMKLIGDREAGDLLDAAVNAG
jgi:hypothetical protein